MAGEEAWWSGWGRWQARLALLLGLPVLLTGAYGTNYVFLAAPTEYRCYVPECEPKPGVIRSPEEWSPEWSQWALPNDTQCRRRAPNSHTCLPTSFDNNTIACDQFVYQQGSSIVGEFGLACEEWKRTLVGTVHNVGMLISLPLIGWLSDRYGRRAALVVSGCGAGIVGVCKSFTSSYGAYLLAELLETVAGASVYPAAFVLMIEWLGVEQRILASLVLGLPLSLGAASLSLLDYLTDSWRLWARIAYPPSFLLLLYPWLLPESARWLLTRGRLAEAIELVKQAASWNKLPVPEESLEQLLHPQKNDKIEAEETVFTALCK
ncbi:organic cation transporter protein [Manduca sexta]|uniref:organic cation transporter protein n=1 Tax=Manduca sexta TaxID=7130 RepID=UPI00188FF0E9|nr:organic cation transporter protein [Manduca sexta]